MKKLVLLLLLLQSELFFSQSGALDTSFNPGSAVYLGSYSQRIKAIAIQSDGKFIVGGDFGSFNGTIVRAIVRLNSNGSIDPSFVIGQGFDYINTSGNTMPSVNSITIQPDGKIIVGGYFSSFNGEWVRWNIIRLNTNGSIDFTFNTVNFGDSINSVVLQNDGKIIVGGKFNSYFNVGTNGVSSSTNCKFISRLNSDGSIDSTFNIGLGPLQIGGFANVNKIIIQPNGKILVGGNFYSFDSQYGNNLARLNSDGSVDTSFQIGTGFQNGTSYTEVTDIDLLPNGFMFITGDFTTFDGVSCSKLVKLLSNGNRDWTFSIDSALNLQIIGTSIQVNGKIVLCATGTNNGVYIWNVIRLNPDGTNDISFVTGTNFNDLPRFSVIQPDGNMMFAGPFLTYNGVPARNIARIVGDLPILNIKDNIIYKPVVYPNPVEKVLNIKLPYEFIITKIIITDSIGKKILQISNEFEIDVQNLKKGIYFIELFSDSKTYKTKFIKK